MLNGIIIVDDKLKGLTPGGYAVSELFTQNAEDLDFSGLKNISMSTTCPNIIKTSGTDSFDTIYKVETGDKIVVVKADNSTHDLTAQGVTSTSVYSNLTPVMTSNTEPYGVMNASASNTNAYKVSIGGTSTYWGTSTPAWIQYSFPSPKVVQQVLIGFVTYTADDFNITASNDGINWTTLGTWTGQGALNGLGPYDLDVGNTTPYSTYRLTVTAMASGSTSHLYYFKMSGLETTYTVNTSSITQGETPKTAHIARESLEINSTALTLHHQSNVGAFGGDTLASTNYYEDLDISGRSIETKVIVSNNGNLISQVQADIWKDT